MKKLSFIASFTLAFGLFVTACSSSKNSATSGQANTNQNPAVIAPNDPDEDRDQYVMRMDLAGSHAEIEYQVNELAKLGYTVTSVTRSEDQSMYSIFSMREVRRNRPINRKVVIISTSKGAPIQMGEPGSLELPFVAHEPSEEQGDEAVVEADADAEPEVIRLKDLKLALGKLYRQGFMVTSAIENEDGFVLVAARDEKQQGENGMRIARVGIELLRGRVKRWGKEGYQVTAMTHYNGKYTLIGTRPCGQRRVFDIQVLRSVGARFECNMAQWSSMGFVATAAISHPEHGYTVIFSRDPLFARPYQGTYEIANDASSAEVLENLSLGGFFVPTVISNSQGYVFLGVR